LSDVGRRTVSLTVGMLLLAYALVYFHRTMTGVMKAEVDFYSKYYGLDSDMLLAVMASAYFYAYAAAQLVVGGLIDLFGVKRATTGFLLLMSLGTLLMTLPNVNALVIGRVVVGASAASIFASYQRVTYLYYAQDKQGKLTSYALMAGNLSAVLATYPLRVALNVLGLNYTLNTLAISSVLLSLTVYILSKDLGFASDREGSIKRGFNHFKLIAGDRHVWGVSLASIASYGSGLAYQSSWGQKHLVEVFNLSIDQVSIYLLLLALVFVVGAPIVGYFSDNVLRRRKPLLISSNAFSILSWSLMFYASLTQDLNVVLSALTCLGISMSLHLIASPMVKERFNRAYSASAIAFFNTILFTGIALTQFVNTLINYLSALTLQISISIVGLIIALKLTQETFKQ